MPKINSNRVSAQKREVRRGRRVISKTLVRRLRARTNGTFALAAKLAVEVLDDAA